MEVLTSNRDALIAEASSAEAATTGVTASLVASLQNIKSDYKISQKLINAGHIDKLRVLLVDSTFNFINSLDFDAYHRCLSQASADCQPLCRHQRWQIDIKHFQRDIRKCQERLLLFKQHWEGLMELAAAAGTGRSASSASYGADATSPEEAWRRIWDQSCHLENATPSLVRVVMSMFDHGQEHLEKEVERKCNQIRSQIPEAVLQECFARFFDRVAGDDEALHRCECELLDIGVPEAESHLLTRKIQREATEKMLSKRFSDELMMVRQMLVFPPTSHAHVELNAHGFSKSTQKQKGKTQSESANVLQNDHLQIQGQNSEKESEPHRAKVFRAKADSPEDNSQSVLALMETYEKTLNMGAGDLKVLPAAMEQLRRLVCRRWGSAEDAAQALVSCGGEVGGTGRIGVATLREELKKEGFAASWQELLLLFEIHGVICSEVSTVTKAEFLQVLSPNSEPPAEDYEIRKVEHWLSLLQARRHMLRTFRGAMRLVLRMRAAYWRETTLGKPFVGESLADVTRVCSEALRQERKHERDLDMSKTCKALLSERGLLVMTDIIKWGRDGQSGSQAAALLTFVFDSAPTSKILASICNEKSRASNLWLPILFETLDPTSADNFPQLHKASLMETENLKHVHALLLRAGIPTMVTSSSAGAAFGPKVAHELQVLNDVASGPGLSELLLGRVLQTVGSMVEDALRESEVAASDVYIICAAFGGCNILATILRKSPVDADAQARADIESLLQDWLQERKKIVLRWQTPTTDSAHATAQKICHLDAAARAITKAEKEVGSETVWSSSDDDGEAGAPQQKQMTLTVAPSAEEPATVEGTDTDPAGWGAVELVVMERLKLRDERQRAKLPPSLRPLEFERTSAEPPPLQTRPQFSNLASAPSLHRSGIITAARLPYLTLSDDSQAHKRTDNISSRKEAQKRWWRKERTVLAALEGDAAETAAVVASVFEALRSGQEAVTVAAPLPAAAVTSAAKNPTGVRRHRTTARRHGGKRCLLPSLVGHLA